MKLTTEMMRSLLRRSVSAVALAISATGCASAPLSDQTASLQDRETLGAQIWGNTCNRCHNLRPAAQYAAEDWPIIVNHMRTRAGLTESEAQAVAAFLQQMAGRAAEQ